CRRGGRVRGSAYWFRFNPPLSKIETEKIAVLAVPRSYMPCRRSLIDKQDRGSTGDPRDDWTRGLAPGVEGDRSLKCAPQEGRRALTGSFEANKHAGRKQQR